ncbi:hypothetical protein DSL72_005955 [Monilinia vaccinii-corymbosi]|uniref:Ribonuclease P protein subunit n=1 Tax=Monilinia vaccinii-corymbosi TaxID=61207 RepID=A0A8A3PH61_9HELO|nr:hypothetical protein DSL72_005955 [Monilinia vaccinii-corymbosi]
MSMKDDNIATQLLSRAHSPESSNRIFTEKVKQRPLHLKPTEPNNAQQHRRLERQRKRALRKKKLKPAPLSAREKRALCLYDVPKSAQKYSIYEPLHKMWMGYISEVLGGENCMPVTGSAAAKLCSADYHGAELEVVRSRCVSRVGVKGIVIKDSKGVFEVITKNNDLKVLPKENTIFKFTIPIQTTKESADSAKNEVPSVRELVFELHGEQFMHRAADRANKKFKPHFLPHV